MINNIIKNVAISYVGEQEISGNKGFLNVEFQNKMKNVGWQQSQAWCAYFAELVWKEAYKDKPEIIKQLNILFSASATATYKNFDLDKNYKVSNKPEIGSLAVWRYGISWKGHIGIVSEIHSTHFMCIEGNTNDEGGREGIEVAIKRRKFDFTIKEKGLNLIGFVIPIKV